MTFRAKQSVRRFILGTAALACACAGTLSAAAAPANLAYDKPAPTINPKLTALSKAMHPKVYKVSNRVYVAVGYGDANSTMVIGDDGLIIIDTTESLTSGRAVEAEFRKISKLPVKGIIYTHHHMDHLGGAAAFVQPQDAMSGKVTVISQADTMKLLASSETAKANPLFTRDIMTARFAYMFGAYLPKGPEGVVNNGTGPAMVAGPVGLVPPNKLVDDTLDVTIAGVRLHIVRTPGETDDAISVWMPDLKMLATGDLLMGETFPNLYTLRGAEIRNPITWYRSIDRVRAFPAEYLVLSHGRPTLGRDKVASVLTNHRDAIQYVHDQAVRLMNKGYGPDELAAAISRLPPHLRDDPYLTQFYGSVSSSVRQLYASYFGWFEGDPTTLNLLPPKDRAQRNLALMGGEAHVVAEAQKALAARDYRWVADMLTDVIRVNPSNMDARKLKAQALRQLGYAEVNANARNWYLTSAQELEGAPLQIQNDWFRGVASPQARVAQFNAMPGRAIIGLFAPRLQAERTLDVHKTLAFVLSDSGDQAGIEIRRGIAEVYTQAPPSPDFTVSTTKASLARLAAGDTTLAQLIESNAATVQGDRQGAETFMSYFDPPLKDWSDLHFTTR